MTPPSSKLARIPGAARALVWLCLAGASPIAAPAQDSEEGDEALRGFSLHDTEGARAAQREAEEHLAAGRIAEALVSLQELLDGHEGEVLGPTRPALPPLPGTPTKRDSERRSQQEVFPGAAQWATQRLLALAPDVQEAYRQRHHEQAARALDVALEIGDRSRVVRVARRWPLTRESRQAWIALGDQEAELGNLSQAAEAWGRALAHALGSDEGIPATSTDWNAALESLESRVDDEERDALRARGEELLSRLAAPETLADPAAALTGAQPGTVIRAPQGARAEGWPSSTPLPAHPYRSQSPDFVLYPARWKDKIFVSTSLEVLAYESISGDLHWRSGETPEWLQVEAAERKEMIDDVVRTRECFVAPATGQGVVVAALQIPYAFEPNVQFGDMEISRELPNRRLFAFDAETGAHLWDTRPPPSWDDESGTFAQRMRIVGPPVIAGSRVLVPTARMRGRIEYHVGCFDLHTGELLWSTPVVTGQRELNMFGRIMFEFCAPPLVVAGRSVLALTQLGTLAALDLFTGDIEWEVLYDARKIPKTNGVNANQLENDWRNSPPVVVGNTVFATPFDGKDLIAVDLSSGAMLWSQNYRTTLRTGLGQNMSRSLNLLIGADEERIYLSGHRVVALGSSQGPVTRTGVDEVRWVYPAGSDRANELDPNGPRPLLDATRIHIPGASLASIDRVTGQLKEDMKWVPGSGRGNLLICDGMLFSLSQAGLTGYFQWDGLVDHARERWQADPTDAGTAVKYAALMRSRADSVWKSDERDKGRAVRILDEASEALEPLAGSDSRVDEELHQTLRLQARVLRDLARPAEALSALERARELAPTREDLRDTLLDEQVIARSRDPARESATLARLLEHCADMPLHIDFSPEPGSLADRLVPVVGSRATGGSRILVLPVGAWALVERVEGPHAAEPLAEELADLHRLLAEYPMVGLGITTAGEWARERIAERLDAGAEEAYAPFEERARALYEAARSLGNDAALERVSELYPHSTAAALANEARLTSAVEQGDGAAAASIVIGELSESWRLSRASERDLRHLLKLAHVLGEGGNPRLRSALYAALARDHGSLRSDLALHEGLTLAELAAAHPRVDPPPLPPASFDHHALQKASIRGHFDPLAALPPAREGVDWRYAFADDQQVLAFAASEPSVPAWTVKLRRGESRLRGEERGFLALPGRLVIATNERVLAIDTSTGEQAWEFDPRGAAIEELAESDGVLAVSFLAHGVWSENPLLDAVVVGLDAAQGFELWRVPLPEDLVGGHILCGEGRLVILPSSSSRRLELRDLFTGRLVAETQIDPLDEFSLHAVFLAGGRLIVPRLLSGTHPDRNKVIGLDLETGDEAWKIDVGGGQRDGAELAAVLTRASSVWLVLRSQTRSTGSASGAIYELSPRIGAVSSAALATLAADDVLLGVRAGRRVEIAAPILFALSEGSTAPRSENSLLRAIHLPYGQRWAREVPFDVDQYAIPTMPAISETTVALTWRKIAKKEERIPQAMTDLLLLDRATGSQRDTQDLPMGVDQEDGVHLVAFGDALFICGDRVLEVLQ